MYGDVHTIYRIDRWYNEIEGSDSRLGRSAITKTDAIAVGRRLAQSRGVNHVIHLRNGEVEKTLSYLPTAQQRR